MFSPNGGKYNVCVWYLSVDICVYIYTVVSKSEAHIGQERHESVRIHFVPILCVSKSENCQNRKMPELESIRI